MGRLWGSWRGYDIDQFEYKILALVSGKDVDIAAARVCSCRPAAIHQLLLRDSARTGMKVWLEVTEPDQ